VSISSNDVEVSAGGRVDVSALGGVGVSGSTVDVTATTAMNVAAGALGATVVGDVGLAVGGETSLSADSLRLDVANSSRLVTGALSAAASSVELVSDTTVSGSTEVLNVMVSNATDVYAGDSLTLTAGAAKINAVSGLNLNSGGKVDVISGSVDVSTGAASVDVSDNATLRSAGSVSLSAVDSVSIVTKAADIDVQSLDLASAGKVKIASRDTVAVTAKTMIDVVAQRVGVLASDIDIVSTGDVKVSAGDLILDTNTGGLTLGAPPLLSLCLCPSYHCAVCCYPPDLGVYPAPALCAAAPLLALHYCSTCLPPPCSKLPTKTRKSASTTWLSPPAAR